MLITITWSPLDDGDTRTDIERVYLHVDAIHDHHSPDLFQMRAVGECWSATVDLPADVVSSYRIIPVDRNLATKLDVATDSRHRWTMLVAHCVPHRIDDPIWHPPTIAGTSGRLILPDAPALPGWVDSDPPRWQQENMHGHRVWTSGLDEAATHLLVISDAIAWSATSLPTALRRLREQQLLPQFGVIAVDTSLNRTELLSRSTDYRDLVTHVLIPAGWQRLGSPADPHRTVIAGESLGGLAALDLVLTRPSSVAMALCTSGSLWYPGWSDGRVGGEMAEEIRMGVPDGVRVHLSAGTGEGRPGVHGASMVEHATAVHRALLDAGAIASLDIGRHGHEMAGWTGAFTRGLLALFPE